MDSNLRNSIICFTIAGLLLYYLCGCATPKRCEAVCGDKALFVASVLAGNECRNGYPMIAIMETDDPNIQHAQAFTYGLNGEKVWWSNW